MMQMTLDDYAPGQRPPRARRTDPESSHAAADRLERSGRAARQLATVLDAVRAHPGLSVAQLSAVSEPPDGMDRGAWRHCLGRRTSELRARGLVKRNGDDGMPPKDGGDFRWWPAREGSA